jgi:polyphosphate kinase
MNPRGPRHVALAKPTEAERGEWYFQRYVRQLPTCGEIALFTAPGTPGPVSSGC